MDASLIRSQVGLIPADDISRSWFAGLKIGATVLAKVSQPRNVAFLRKFMALMDYSFQYWEEMAEPVLYKGQPIKPNFDRFRRDIAVLAGFGHPVANLRGEVRWEADSISFARMSAATFEKLYSACIDTLLNQVFKDPRWDEASLRATVDKITGFAND
jgi:hypothetical protein